MINILRRTLKESVGYFLQLIKGRVMTDFQKDLEILYLRSQLNLFLNQVELGKISKPNSTLSFRELWYLISKFDSNWKQYLFTFRSETVIRWHRELFKRYWAKKSKKVGRPPIDDSMIELILKIHKDNPNFSPKKIQEKIAQLGVQPVPSRNTISKYLPSQNKTHPISTAQTWLPFIKNHMNVTWATDFLTVPTIKFEILYVLIIIHHETRQIVHFSVTKNPNSIWLVQQFRNATPYGEVPKYLIHDNDPVFKSIFFNNFLKSSSITSKPTSYRSPWQNAYAERANGTLRRELLDYCIPLNECHLENLLKEYICNYYNPHRTHQGINCNSPIPQTKTDPISSLDIKLESTPILNGIYHTYKRVA